MPVTHNRTENEGYLEIIHGVNSKTNTGEVIGKINKNKNLKIKKKGINNIKNFNFQITKKAQKLIDEYKRVNEGFTPEQIKNLKEGNSTKPVRKLTVEEESVAGSYDNEACAIFAIVFSFYAFAKAVKSGSVLAGCGSALVREFFFAELKKRFYIFVQTFQIPKIHCLPLKVKNNDKSEVKYLKEWC